MAMQWQCKRTHRLRITVHTEGMLWRKGGKLPEREMLAKRSTRDLLTLVEHNFRYSSVKNNLSSRYHITVFYCVMLCVNVDHTSC